MEVGIWRGVLPVIALSDPHQSPRYPGNLMNSFYERQCPRTSLWVVYARPMGATVCTHPTRQSARCCRWAAEGSPRHLTCPDMDLFMRGPKYLEAALTP